MISALQLFRHIYNSSVYFRLKHQFLYSYKKIIISKGYKNEDSRPQINVQDETQTDTMPSRRCGNHPDNERDRDSISSEPGIIQRWHPSGEMLAASQIWFYLWLLITKLFLGMGCYTYRIHTATVPVGRLRCPSVLCCLVVINLVRADLTLRLEVWKPAYWFGGCCEAAVVELVGTFISVFAPFSSFVIGDYIMIHNKFHLGWFGYAR